MPTAMLDCAVSRVVGRVCRHRSNAAQDLPRRHLLNFRPAPTTSSKVDTVRVTLGWCRHCGADPEMTDEHLPPRSASNSSHGTLYNEQEGALVAVRSYRDGHAIPSLCKSCNTDASIRGLPQAYQAWRDDVVSNLELAAATYEYETGGARADLWGLHKRDGGASVIPIEHGRDAFTKQMTNLHPGRIARQVLGMTLAVQSTRSLLDNPQLKAAYFSDRAASIEPFSLHVAQEELSIPVDRDVSGDLHFG